MNWYLVNKKDTCRIKNIYTGFDPKLFMLIKYFHEQVFFFKKDT